jgi:hypothetical protein
MSASSTRPAWTEADLITVDDLYREYGRQLDAEHAVVQL